MRGSETADRLGKPLAAVFATLSCLGAVLAFAQETGETPISASPAALASMTPAQVQARIDAMSAGEREALAQRRERFESATPEERQTYREMHAELVADPQGERLVGLAHRYAEWVATLTPDDRRALQTLAPSERVAKIKELMKSEESRQFALLVSTDVADEDYRAIGEWFREYAYDNVERFREVIPRDAWEHISRADDDKRWFQMMWAYRLNSSDDLPIPKPAPEDLERLAASLTPSTRAAFERAGDDLRKLRLLEEWGRAASIARLRMGPEIDPKELAAFYRDKLAPAVRSELEKLPPEEVSRQLRFLFVMTQQRPPTPDDRVELDEAKALLDRRGRLPFPGPGGPREGGPPFGRGPGPPPPGPGSPASGRDGHDDARDDRRGSENDSPQGRHDDHDDDRQRHGGPPRDHDD